VYYCENELAEEHFVIRFNFHQLLILSSQELDLAPGCFTQLSFYRYY